MKLRTLGIYFLYCHSHIISQGLDILRVRRNELMQGRIQVTYGHRSAFQGLEHGLEVTLLERNQFI